MKLRLKHISLVVILLAGCAAHAEPTNKAAIQAAQEEKNKNLGMAFLNTIPTVVGLGIGAHWACEAINQDEITSLYDVGHVGASVMLLVHSWQYGKNVLHYLDQAYPVESPEKEQNKNMGKACLGFYFSTMCAFAGYYGLASRGKQISFADISLASGLLVASGLSMKSALYYWNRAHEEPEITVQNKGN